MNPKLRKVAWTSWFGCAALALGNTRRYFARMRLTRPSYRTSRRKTSRSLGVTALGHRRKLLDAIAALRTDAGATGPSAAAPRASSSTPSAHPEDRAERRQVTVMFSDLVGSTALSARMDPEDLREVISAYQKCVAETVQRFGGFVAKYMGVLIAIIHLRAGSHHP